MNPFKRELEDAIAASTEHKSPVFVAANDKAPAETKPNLATDIEAFIKKAAGMYDGQRRYLLDLEASYDAERTKLTDSFRRRLDDLHHEATDTLRELDAKHGKIIRDARLILDRLSNLNGD